MERIAVLLTVHNRREKTLYALSRLFAVPLSQQYVLDVYLTDDGCTDGTAEAVAAKYPTVHILKGDGSLFWNRGMRLAWEAAAVTNPEFYLWLNDDTYLFDKALDVLLSSSATKNHKAIILGTTCDTATGKDITYGGKIKGGAYVFDEKDCSSCIYMNGNIVLIPRYVFERVGYNDNHYRHAMGDYDYGLMAIKKGIEIFAAPGFLGQCDLHDTIATWKNPDKPLGERWKAMFRPTGANPFEYFYYRKKHFGVFAACQTFISNFVHLLFPRLWTPDHR